MTQFAVTVTMKDGTDRHHTTAQRGWDAAMAWARSKYFKSWRAELVGMISVKVEK